MNEAPEYVLDRVFDAPPETVWKAWTNPELLARWYGPGIETIIHKFDFKPGGVWLNEMKMGSNSDLSKMLFKEIILRERIVWEQSSTDAEWNVISNQMMPDWPSTMLTTVIFKKEGSMTKVKLTWAPIDATDAEISCFTGAVNNMGKGWESGFSIIDKILEELQA